MSTVQVWTIKTGDNLPLIAAKVYSDARLWRQIADANDIHNPLLFPVLPPEPPQVLPPDKEHDLGRVLLIPRQQR